MTPRQFFRAVSGWNWREERKWERTAMLGRWLLGAWCENPPSVDELLGREESEGPAIEEVLG